MAFVQQDSESHSQFQTFNSIIGIGPFNNLLVNSSSSSSSCQGLVKLLKVPYMTTTDVGVWNYKQETEFKHDLSNKHLFFCGKMDVVEGDSFKGGDIESKDDFLNENSRSSSPSIEGQQNENSGKGCKVDPKVCGVCGDKALGNNFNAITCESCKAFFRRNALKPKDFVCPFNDNCKVDPITRRFCQKCRLKKCFDIGMKKEWIMTDEEKKMKKQKIEQNRLKRQSSDAPPLSGGNEGPLPKTSCILHENHESNSPPTNESLSTVSEEYRGIQSSSSESNNLSSVLIHSEDQTNNNINNTNTIHNNHHRHNHHEDIIHPCIIQRTPKDPLSYDNSSNSSDTLTPIIVQQNPISFSHVDSSPGHQLFNRLNGQQEHNVGSQICSKNGVDSTIPVHNRSHDNMNHHSVWQSDAYILNECSPGKIIISPHHSNISISPGKSRIYGVSQHTQHTNNTNNELNNHTPLLSSLIRPGLAESPPDSDLVDCSGSNIIVNNSSNNVQQTTSLNSHTYFQSNHEIGEHQKYSSNTHHSHNSSHIQNEEYLSSGHCPNNNSNTNIEEDTIPLPLNTMDSILSVAITAEYNSFGMLGRNSGTQSKELNKAERAKLNELRSASQALHAPVDDERPFKLTETSDPSLINVINLTDIAIRRLIQMSKKISGFKNMCQEDQIALLKGSCTEMMILRSAVSYDPDRDSWNIPHSFGYNIKLGVLKEARGNLYEEHQRFVSSFKSIWRSDENIMIILCAITLFTAERPNVVHRDVVKLEQDSYYYLLKRYLESTLNGCEARSTYLQLIRKIAELHELNSNHLRVFLEVNPREVEPLLIEIFDLKQ